MSAGTRTAKGSTLVILLILILPSAGAGYADFDWFRVE